MEGSEFENMDYDICMTNPRTSIGEEESTTNEQVQSGRQIVFGQEQWYGEYESKRLY